MKKKEKIVPLNKINIGGHKILVELVVDPFAGTERTVGDFTFENLTIRVANDIRWDLMASTVLHEVIHVIDRLNALGLKEDQVGPLAQGLYQTLRDNPTLVAAIMKWDEKTNG